jgi:hypothetical protein
MQISEDIFTARIDAWFAEKSAAIRASAKVKTNSISVGVAKGPDMDSKLEFGVSKIVRSIADHEAERRKRSARNRA